MSHYIDLNSDLGESFGNYTLGMDSEVLNHVTSANVACGWHAGDPLIMDATVRMCKEKGVAVGAHPGYPDLMGFGRRAMAVNPGEAKAYMTYQLGALQAFCDSYGVIQEVFADRGYTDEGTLVPRTEHGAFIKDPQEALERVLMMVKEGKVVTNTGNTIDIVADSICVHGDNPEAIAFTKYIREGLAKAGVTVANFQDRKK